MMPTLEKELPEICEDYDADCKIIGYPEVCRCWTSTSGINFRRVQLCPIISMRIQPQRKYYPKDKNGYVSEM